MHKKEKVPRMRIDENATKAGTHFYCRGIEKGFRIAERSRFGQVLRSGQIRLYFHQEAVRQIKIQTSSWGRGFE